jgi:hypothetical protein
MIRPALGQRRGQRNFRAAELLAIAAVVAIAFLLADAAALGPNFNPDESRWLSRAHYLADLADPLGPTWADRYMTRGQPPLGSYAMGLALLIQGRDLETNPPWDFSLPWEENITLGYKPIPEDLAAGRRASAALVALTALAVNFVARSFVTTPWAIAAGGLYAVHPFTVYIGSIAMSDALFGFLIALSALAAAALARRPGWRRAIVLGALLGLGGATKLSPLFIAVGLSAAGVATCVVAGLRLQRFPHREARYAVLGLIVAVAAMTTFIASYPYLWPDPIGRMRHLFAFRAEEMATQASDWPVMAVPTRREALRRVAVNFTERYSFTSSLATSLGTHGAMVPLRAIELTIPTAGIAIMAGIAARDGPYSPRMLVLAVLGAQTLITILAMRSEFDRYHVPMAILGAMAAAVALRWLVAFARAAATSRADSPRAALAQTVQAARER